MRHPWVNRFCTSLDFKHIGATASVILSAFDSVDFDRAALVRLPTWIWRRPAINIGRKAHAPDGGIYEFPVRVQWESDPLTLLKPGKHREVSWHAEGLGHKLAGTALLRFGEPTELGNNVPTEIAAPPMRRTEVRAMLQHHQEAGSLAYWELVEMLAPFIRRSLMRANSSISQELRPDSLSPLLDEADLVAIQSDWELGVTGDTRSTSRVGRLLDRCLTPGTLAGGDPLRYVMLALRRDAPELVRRRLGDPRIGAHLRAFADSRPDANPIEVIREYNKAHPRASLSTERAAAALLGRLDVHAAPELLGLPSELEAIAGSQRGDHGT